MCFVRLARVLLFAPALLFSLPRISAAQIISAAQTPQITEGASVNEDDPRIGRWMRSIESDLIAEKFDDLERMANDYRASKSRVPGGEWRLRLFYTALDAPQQ